MRRILPCLRRRWWTGGGKGGGTGGGQITGGCAAGGGAGSLALGIFAALALVRRRRPIA